MALTDYVIMPGEDYQAICDAVREKRNETEVIKSGEIAGKIQGIEVEPKLQDKTVTPSSKNQTITADEGYDGLDTITVEAVELQDKTVIPANVSKTVTADDGYDALGTVTVEGDAELLPENIREGVEIFGVTGIVVEGEPIDELAKFIGETKVAMMTGTVIEDEYHSTINYAPSCANMFLGCGTLITVPLFDTSRATRMDSMFQSCGRLTTVPLFDTSNVTRMDSMFNTCTNLTTVPLFDTSNVTRMDSMFQSCGSLTTVPLFDTSNVTTMNSMFGSCTNLTTVPLFDTSNVTNMSYMFNTCTNLTTVPLFDTSNVTNMSYMFGSCWDLTTVPLFDMSNVTNMNGMFGSCRNLTECYLRNIKANLQVGSGTTCGHLLTLDSLIHLIKECRDTGSLKTLTVGSANLEKLANVYVRTIEITDEMRAEDAYIDEKLPFEVCESTDEGAMLIVDYAVEKNWSIK